jgi:hypothetical protein
MSHSGIHLCACILRADRQRRPRIEVVPSAGDEYIGRKQATPPNLHVADQAATPLYRRGCSDFDLVTHVDEHVFAQPSALAQHELTARRNGNDTAGCDARTASKMERSIYPKPRAGRD